MQSWLKQGRIFNPIDDIDWAKTHSALPTPFVLKDGTIRVFYTSRDFEQKSMVSYFDLHPNDITKPFNITNKAVVELGGLGTFDDRGHTSSCIVEKNDSYYYYLNGYNIGTPARYRISIGLAMSDDLENFTRYSEGPIMDRSIHDPCGVATPFIVKINDLYHMWYTSFRKWEWINSDAEPFYCIRHAVSEDAIKWSPDGKECIELIEGEGGIVRPSVIIRNGVFHMWYSYRKNTGYRERLEASYRIGYSKSLDGVTWERLDHLIDLSISAAGWDERMVAYPFVFECKNEILMLYNGNGFGQSGIGLAKLVTSL